MKSTLLTYLGRLILMLFVMTNLGFTRVTETCTMSSIECCGENPADMRCARKDSHTPEREAQYNAAKCMAMSTLGGLSGVQAVESKTNPVNKQLDGVSLPPAIIVESSSLENGIPRMRVSAPHAPPQRTPKYLRIRILLI